MTILRHYVMTAVDGQGASLADALKRLAGQVEPLDGCEKVELLVDPRNADTYVFIEHWASIDAHKAAGAALSKDAFAAVMAALARPPEGRYLQTLRLR